jgi:hypothetical protein
MVHTPCCVTFHVAAAIIIARLHIDAHFITYPRHECLQISSIGCSWKCLGNMQAAHMCRQMGLSEWFSSVYFILN